MDTRTVLDAARSETLDARPTSRPSRYELPPDLLRDASKRLSVVALVSGLLWTVGSTIAHIVSITPTHQHAHDVGAVNATLIPDFIVAGIVVVSFACSTTSSRCSISVS